MSEPGAIVYRGPSMLTGDPIVAILTGLDGGSRNPKTGPMVQGFVLRADVGPMDAKRRNIDDAVCGDCQLRGRDGRDSGCYVAAWVSPLAVYKQFVAGAYLEPSWAGAQALVEGRGLRLCAYGDPVAVPFTVWSMLLATAGTHVGYTHSWKIADERFKAVLMASVDDPAEWYDAQCAGWRTFRIRRPGDDLIAGAEFVCPASDEAGHRVTCQQCQLCRGTSSPARSVAIVAHGKPSSLRGFHRAAAVA